MTYVNEFSPYLLILRSHFFYLDISSLNQGGELLILPIKNEILVEFEHKNLSRTRLISILIGKTACFDAKCEKGFFWYHCFTWNFYFYYL